jgi:hypothetical protein
MTDKLWGNTTNGTGVLPTPENTLTEAKFRAMWDQMPKPEPDLFNPFRLPRFGGRRIFEAPPPPAKIQVADIRLKDGTPLLPAEFRARINLELVARFGYRDDPFKDRIYMLGSYGLVMSRANHMIINSHSLTS